MSEYTSALGKALAIIITLFVFSVFSGSLLWVTWDAIFTFFPTVALPKDPSWWQTVKIVWLVSTISRIILPNIKIERE